MPRLIETPETRAAKAAYAREWRRRAKAEGRLKPRDRRAYNRAKVLATYGMTVEEYEARLEAQDGRCKGCGRPETALGVHGEVKRLAVDHDHETGEVRGLLCQTCNTALGLLDDDPERLLALIDYLLKP